MQTDPSLSNKRAKALLVCQGRPSFRAPSQCRLAVFWWIILVVMDQNGSQKKGAPDRLKVLWRA